MVSETFFQIDPMNLNELPLEQQSPENGQVTVKLIGVGGAGSSAVGRLSQATLTGLSMAVLNTDRQALAASPLDERILFGTKVTRGLGAGGDPDLGHEAAESDRDKIVEVTRGCDLIFLAAGLGGGTGTGATPAVAEIAAENGALVIAFVTMPFSFEGGRRAKQAEEGLQHLRSVCDAVIPLPNDILLQEGDDDSTVMAAFACADEWMGRGVQSIWSILSRPGLINLDFASLRQVFTSRGGKTLFALGAGAGEAAGAEAIESLALCPLLHAPENTRRADRLLINIAGGPGLTLAVVNEIMDGIRERFGRDTDIVFGALVDEQLADSVTICMLGTTEMGGGRRQYPTKRPIAAVTQTAVQNGGGKQSSSRKRNEPKEELLPLGDQDELELGEIESRGSFEKTGRNLYQGQDLDVPTYMRKGIKISL